jgi:Pyruvate/2-oxoacid:ferredoxin oxidoreductase delta subunit
MLSSLLLASVLASARSVRIQASTELLESESAASAIVDSDMTREERAQEGETRSDMIREKKSWAAEHMEDHDNVTSMQTSDTRSRNPRRHSSQPSTRSLPRQGDFDTCNACVSAGNGASLAGGLSVNFGTDVHGAILGASVNVWSKGKQLKIARIGVCHDFQSNLEAIYQALQVGDVLIGKLLADHCADCNNCQLYCPWATSMLKQWKLFKKRLITIVRHAKFVDCCAKVGWKIRMSNFDKVRAAWNTYIKAVDMARGKAYDTVMAWVDPKWRFEVLYVGIPIPYPGGNWYQIPKRVSKPMDTRPFEQFLTERATANTEQQTYLKDVLATLMKNEGQRPGHCNK